MSNKTMEACFGIIHRRPQMTEAITNRFIPSVFVFRFEYIDTRVWRRVENLWRFEDGGEY